MQSKPLPLKTTIANSALSVTIHHKGAELTSIRAVKSNREYLWDGNPEYWGKHSPILFPIVGTLKDGSYSFDNKTYQLSRHGFARDCFFELVSHTATEAVFSLQSDDNTKKLYPFDFELQIVYHLHKSELTVTYIVLNKSSQYLYYSIGGHPAFALPLPFENYSLQFEPEEQLISYELENDLLCDKTKALALIRNELPLTYSLFEKDALIFKTLQSKEIQLLENNSPILNFKFNDFPNFGIWTKINAPFLCLEPWAGYSDVWNANGRLTDKEGIQILESNSSKEYSFTIEIV